MRGGKKERGGRRAARCVVVAQEREALLPLPRLLPGRGRGVVCQKRTRGEGRERAGVVWGRCPGGNTPRGRRRRGGGLGGPRGTRRTVRGPPRRLRAGSMGARVGRRRVRGTAGAERVASHCCCAEAREGAARAWGHEPVGAEESERPPGLLPGEERLRGRDKMKSAPRGRREKHTGEGGEAEVQPREKRSCVRAGRWAGAWQRRRTSSSAPCERVTSLSPKKMALRGERRGKGRGSRSGVKLSVEKGAGRGREAGRGASKALAVGGRRRESARCEADGGRGRAAAGKRAQAGGRSASGPAGESRCERRGWRRAARTC